MTFADALLADLPKLWWWLAGVAFALALAALAEFARQGPAAHVGRRR